MELQPRRFTMPAGIQIAQITEKRFLRPDKNPKRRLSQRRCEMQITIKIINTITRLFWIPAIIKPHDGQSALLKVGNGVLSGIYTYWGGEWYSAGYKASGVTYWFPAPFKE